MKLLSAPKGWSQILMTPPATPWSALRAALAAGGASTAQTLIEAGLRGRGGGGFLTGEKWRTTASSEADRRYAVANAYESDPAVFANRLLLEKNALGVVEGLAIAALSVGAREALIGIARNTATRSVPSRRSSRARSVTASWERACSEAVESC